MVLKLVKTQYPLKKVACLADLNTKRIQVAGQKCPAFFLKWKVESEKWKVENEIQKTGLVYLKRSKLKA